MPVLPKAVIAKESNYRTRRGLMVLGFCLFLGPMSPSFAGKFKPFNTFEPFNQFKPFDNGKTLRQIQQTRALRLESQKLELEIRQLQKQQQLHRRQQGNRQLAATIVVPRSGNAKELLSRYEVFIKYRKYRYPDSIMLFDTIVHRPH